MNFDLKQTALGIEFGSTRIKAVLIDTTHHTPLVSGEYEWENKLIDGIWTYDIKDVWLGLQMAYRKLAEEFELKYKEETDNSRFHRVFCNDAWLLTF